MFKVKETMSRDVITVKETTPLNEALNLLLKENITGLPVVSGDMFLIGMVSEKDMLKLLYDSQTENKLVSDVMTREVVSFDEDTDLFDVCECLIKNNFKRVPILSQSKLVGIVSRKDIIKSILKYRNITL